MLDVYGASHNEKGRTGSSATCGRLISWAGPENSGLTASARFVFLLGDDKRLIEGRHPEARAVETQRGEKLFEVRGRESGSPEHDGQSVIASCTALAEALTQRYDLTYCDVVPSDPASTSTVLGEAAAAYLERILGSPTPLILALGTGRTMRASVDELPQMDCRQHKFVSLVGNIAPDGSASFFDVITKISDTVKGPVSLTCAEQTAPGVRCAITRPRPHLAIGSPPRLERPAASSTR